MKLREIENGAVHEGTLTSNSSVSSYGQPGGRARVGAAAAVLVTMAREKLLANGHTTVTISRVGVGGPARRRVLCPMRRIAMTTSAGS